MSGIPVLSVIIAVHNGEKTIDATLQSLIDAAGNELDNVEIIIINDASQDVTDEKLIAFSKKYKNIIISSVAFRNIGKVRQHGVNLSRGRYLTMLDSDDLMIANSLPPFINFLSTHDPDLLITGLHEIRDLKKINHRWSGFKPKPLTREESITRFLIHKDFQAHLIGQFIKRELLLRHPIPSMTCYEDSYIFPALLMSAKNIFFQRDSHYYYIKRPGSLSNTPDKCKINNLILCTKRMEIVFPEKFFNLILCHWLDIYIKHCQWIDNPQDKKLVNNRMKMTRSLGFFMAANIRFSYKRKALSTLWEK